MARQSLQDKFQIQGPWNKNDDDTGRTWEWAKEDALRPRPVSGSVADNVAFSRLAQYKKWQKNVHLPQNAYDGAVDYDASGQSPQHQTGLSERVVKENGGMKLTTMGETDVTDVSTGDMLRAGFCVHNMDAADDQYTGEHMDHFYGDAEGEDDEGNHYTGFVERNNYLDRM